MVLALTVCGIVVALVLVGLFVFGLRRRLIQRSGGTFDCSLRWNAPERSGGEENGKGWSYGIARIGLGRTATFLNLMPLSALAMAVAFLGEKLIPPHIAGFLLVLTGTWLVNRKKSNESPLVPEAGRRPAA